MGFEDFSVILEPKKTVSRHDNPEALPHVIAKMQQIWPSMQLDHLEMENTWLLKPDQTKQIYIYETSTNLVQILTYQTPHSTMFSLTLRFAYCCPRRGDPFFCKMVEWLMKKFQLSCHVVPDLAPAQQGISKDISEAKEVYAVLLPSIEYNRNLWQQDAGTDAEAILRPGDAVARFITPQLETVT